MIENNLLAISNVMFKDRSKWNQVTTDQKEQFAFIFNRYFSKVYPEMAYMNNLKDSDKSVVMDLWFGFFNNKPYPKWFWSKTPKVTSSDISDDDFDLIMKKLNLDKESDLIYLIDKFPEIINEEIQWIKGDKTTKKKKS